MLVGHVVGVPTEFIILIVVAIIVVVLVAIAVIHGISIQHLLTIIIQPHLLRIGIIIIIIIVVGIVRIVKLQRLTGNHLRKRTIDVIRRKTRQIIAIVVINVHHVLVSKLIRIGRAILIDEDGKLHSISVRAAHGADEEIHSVPLTTGVLARGELGDPVGDVVIELLLGGEVVGLGVAVVSGALITVNEVGTRAAGVLG